MLESIIFYVFLLVSLSLSLSQLPDERYAVVVDAGSTGSRGFVLKFSRNSEGVKNVTSKKVKKVEPG